MKMRMTMAGLAMSACVAGLAVADHHAEHEMTPEMMAMMEKGAPNENHERLSFFVGDWHATMTYRMAPGMSAEPGEFDSTYEMVMGGRFVEERVTSETPMGFFEGRGFLGYDNSKQRYVAIWLDNANTSIFESEGFYDSESQTMEFHGSGPDMSGEWKKTRSVLEKHGDDTFTMREWVYEDDGTRWQRFEAEYQRK